MGFSYAELLLHSWLPRYSLAIRPLAWARKHQIHKQEQLSGGRQ